MGKINLGIVITDSNFGGGGRYVVDISTYINKNIFNLFVIVPRESMISEKLVNIEDITILETDGIKDKSISFKGIREIRKIIKRNNIEILHTNSCLSGRISGILCGVRRIVYTRHCIQPKRTGIKKYINKVIEKAISKNTKVIAVSKAVYENLKNEGIDDGKIILIYNGVNTDNKEYNLNELKKKYSVDEKIVITLIGRLETVKGQENMIDIVRILYQKSENFQVLFVGEGSNRHILKRDIEREQLPIKIIGHVDEIEEICSVSDIIVNTSNSEALSISTLEAFVYEKPVVAFDIDGLTEVITDETDGFLVEYKNYEEFSEKLLNLIDNKNMRKEMGELGRKKVVEKFNIVEKVKELEKVYLEGGIN